LPIADLAAHKDRDHVLDRAVPDFPFPGGKDVLVHGAAIAQRALGEGLLDELAIHLVPVLFGEGRRLFEHLGVDHRELDRIRVLEGEDGVVHLLNAARR
jgi:dihydrofolate reductase